MCQVIEEEYNKLAPEEQKRCTNVWCVTFLEWTDPRPPSRSRHTRVAQSRPLRR